MNMRALINLMESAAEWPVRPAFHGTPSLTTAKSIMQNGLIPQGGKSRWNGDLKSVKGRSYLSTNLFYVLSNYGFGNNEPAAFILVFDLDHISDPHPDEDAVPMFMNHYISVKPAADEDVILAPKDFASPEVKAVCERLIELVKAMPREKRFDMFYGSDSQRRKMPIVFGKRALKVLDPAARDIIRREDFQGRMAVEQVLHPVSCWKVANGATSNMQLVPKPDFASFRANAERIA